MSLASIPAISARRVPRPFLKWVGGKRQLLTTLRQYVPSPYANYHEPFLGGGALFFDLCPPAATLCDANERLIRTYRGLRDQCEKVIRLLSRYPHDKTFFLELRSKDIDQARDAELAAWFIYLNRTGYNGLYRVNRSNQFNVPFGRNHNPTICDAENLRGCSKALAKAALEVAPFESILARARPADFVYFDPPYVPVSATSSFTSYTQQGFDLDAQTLLRDVALELVSRGVHVLVSNSASPLVRDLYRDFTLEEVAASRMVNSDPSRRGKIVELLIRARQPRCATPVRATIGA